MKDNERNRTYGIEGDLDEVEKLHRERRIFTVINDQVIIAPEKSPQSHKEWIKSLGLVDEDVENIMNNNLRGYIDPQSNIYLYKGYGFGFDELDKIQVPEIVKSLGSSIHFPDGARIFGGLKIGKAGEKWDAKEDLGTTKINE